MTELQSQHSGDRNKVIDFQSNNMNNVSVLDDMFNHILLTKLIHQVFPLLLIEDQHVRNFALLDAAVGAGPAQAVGSVDGGGRQGLGHAHPEVDTGQVHHHGHAHAVGVGVEV